MITVPDPHALASWFAPERPGPMLYPHAMATGVGRFRADRWPDPRAVAVTLPGNNHALRGDPDALNLTDVVGIVEAPEPWGARLDGHPWQRVVAVRPDLDPPPSDARLLVAADAETLAALDPDIAWIHDSWGGAQRLAAAGVARAVIVDGRAVSVAVPFHVGTRHEDIGVVTDPDFRGRGLSTACAAALIGDIRARGRIPSWTTSVDNTASLAVAARLGFVHERDDLLHAVGVPVP